jgi:hypothetical protein
MRRIRAQPGGLSAGLRGKPLDAVHHRDARETRVLELVEQDVEVVTESLRRQERLDPVELIDAGIPVGAHLRQEELQ